MDAAWVIFLVALMFGVGGVFGSQLVAYGPADPGYLNAGGKKTLWTYRLAPYTRLELEVRIKPWCAWFDCDSQSGCYWVDGREVCSRSYSSNMLNAAGPETILPAFTSDGREYDFQVGYTCDNNSNRCDPTVKILYTVTPVPRPTRAPVQAPDVPATPDVPTRSPTTRSPTFETEYDIIPTPNPTTRYPTTPTTFKYPSSYPTAKYPTIPDADLVNAAIADAGIWTKYSLAIILGSVGGCLLLTCGVGVCVWCTVKTRTTPRLITGEAARGSAPFASSTPAAPVVAPGKAQQATALPQVTSAIAQV